MSTPDQPESPALTRRQLREIRNTGTTPVQTPEDVARSEAAEVENEPVAPSAEPDMSEPDVGRPRPVTSVPAAPEQAEHPVPPSHIADPGVAPLTRRQAREHERIRTASVPIIAPDAEPSRTGSDDSAASPTSEADSEDPVDVPGATPIDVVADVSGSARPTAVADDALPTAIVNPHFGSGLLAGETPAIELPPSFDQLITRNGSSGVSSSTPNALILSQTPAVAPLVAPVTATGEVLITGTFDLPEGLGSVGHAPGIHDGREADAVLIDGELPAASSPTPIAASAAISQVRNNDEIIRPPAPEKGGKLVIALIITAGVAFLTAASVLVLAFTTGAL